MKLGVRGLAFNTPKPVVRRAMFWGSRQLLELISHSWRERFFLEGRDLCFRFHQYRCLKLTLRSGRVLAVALMHSLLRGRYLTSKRGNERHLKLVKLQQKKTLRFKRKWLFVENTFTPRLDSPPRKIREVLANFIDIGFNIVKRLEITESKDRKRER